MKNTLFGIIVVTLLMQIYAMRQSNEKPAPIYNKITNEELVTIIKKFVEKGKGTHSDSVSKFLSLRIKKQIDRSYVITLGYMHNEAHNQITKYPLIVCAPIAGKKIFVISDNNYFIAPNVPQSGLYFRDDCPEVYKKFLKDVEKDKKRDPLLAPSRVVTYSGVYVTAYFGKYGKLKNVVYRNMN